VSFVHVINIRVTLYNNVPLVAAHQLILTNNEQSQLLLIFANVI